DALSGLYTRRAFAGGLDWLLRWNRGIYQLSGWLGFSHLKGTAPAIDRVQRSAVHFFQRPDAAYVHYDSLRTSLTGTVANFVLSKTGGGHWLYDLGAGWEAPAYDPNDAGRLSSADERFGYAALRYRETRPSWKFQNYSVGLFANGGWDFGGDRQYLFTELSWDVTFRNFWTINGYFDFLPRSFDHNATRGGPTMATPQSWNVVTRVGNNFGAKTSWNARVYYGEDELGGETYRLSGGLSLRPGPQWQLSVTPNYLRDITSRQYLDSAPGGPAATFGTRYLFSFIDQSTFLMQLRLNYTLRPELTLDLYAEPFAASGRYYGLGELAAARGFGLLRYGTSGTTIARDQAGDYTITDGADTILVANPDFNVLSFRSNAVLRWEWRPGSTLFLVWQQNRFGFDTRGAHVGPRDLWDSFRATGDNFLAIKASYWFSVQ
ncbi:MAG TPA: DUF5916 domain-containing protein, partial [Gemmatimonadales bacterium]|nr:DUF5916 domain-containing protein [Gemmatimonadales bacterium]